VVAIFGTVAMAREEEREGELDVCGMAGMAMHMHAMLAPLGFLCCIESERGPGDQMV
jgi:hypothetical protein